MNLSSVYSLAVHHQSLWLLSGLESGGINLQSVRHEEGKRITTLRQHTSAVSVLTLARDERSVLSGSWDKSIFDWDLNTGQVKRKFETSGGQVSAIEQRPLSALPVPDETENLFGPNGTFSSNNAQKPASTGFSFNGAGPSGRSELARPTDSGKDGSGSPDSLFGDNDSLFGESKDAVAPSAVGGFGDDEEDELSRAIANGMQQQADEEGDADVDMTDLGGAVQPPMSAAASASMADFGPPQTGSSMIAQTDGQTGALQNGLPHSEEPYTAGGRGNGVRGQAEEAPCSETTFVDASIDGTLRIWDRRQADPVARIYPSRSTPPWCMNACWSPDGNSLYAGRRNGTVDEYSFHKGLRAPSRTFKFPGVSGAVSAVRAMPNSRHLVW